jgi:hypothetical protein
MKELNTSPDATYTSINLSIFAVTEVFVGAFTASLPPLRKTFEDLLHKVLPESVFGSTKDTENSYGMRTVGSKRNTRVSRARHDLDNESDTASSENSEHGIVCTTEVSLSVDDKSFVEARKHKSWV